jgi:pimeloyl-ACP methyl ester carboxylesterase
MSDRIGPQFTTIDGLRVRYAAIAYAQSYREQLPVLADLLPHIDVPVRIVAGANDQVVPPVNAEFLHQRLPNSRVDLIADAGHFCWEERPAEYAAGLRVTLPSFP